MNKNKGFQKWAIVKNRLEESKRVIYFKEREVWWCSLGLNVGFEQDGKDSQFERPVLIVRKFGKELFWALPMTSKDKSGKYYYRFEHKGLAHSVILSQLRALSSKRLLRKVRKFPEKDFEEVRKSVKSFLYGQESRMIKNETLLAEGISELRIG